MSQKKNGRTSPAIAEDSPESSSEARGLEAVAEGAPTETEALRDEVRGLRESLLRKAAEFDNFRKRADRERQQSAADAAADVFRELIPVLDNFDRALDAKVEGDALRQGVALIARQMRLLLESRGVSIEDPLGLRFDPKRHEALSHEHSPDHPEGTVLEVLQKGYSWKDRLLRPALVKVAKASPEEGEPGSHGDVSNNGGSSWPE